MKFKFTPIARAISMMLLGATWAANAQQTPAPAQQGNSQDNAKQVDSVVVTGIRAALEQSINQKKNSDSLVEVITAEDIGKMPDKNVADSLQRVPGVTISSASASEGGFDENDRVSLRGTNPSLTQTIINGHMVGSGDWFVLNQVGTVGRSVSYSLLPSELVARVIVRKSAQADLVEGGVAGTVDIITRKPLEFRKPLTLEVQAGAVYADLPGKTDPQLSALVNWKNDANTFGIMVQAFSQKRSLRRDGVEMLGYSKIDATIVDSQTGQLRPTRIAATNPDLVGVSYPNAIGSALFEQTRERTGGLLALQFKPSADLSFGLTGFTSEMEATNYNRNYLVWTSRILSRGEGQAPDPGYVVRNGTLVSATFTPVAGRQYVIVDQIYRPDSRGETSFLNLDGQWKSGDLTIGGKLGSSRGKGETPTQAVFEGDVLNTGARYTLNGIGRAPDSALLAGNAASFTGTTLDWIFGASPARTTDKEDWAQLDGEYRLDSVVNAVKFGVRAAKHSRDTQFVAQGPNFAADPFNPANLPAWNGQTYPGDFGSGLSGNFLRNVWQIDPGVLQAWGDRFSNRNPLTRQYWPGEFAMEEKNTAAYAMADFNGEGWSGNAGLRFVKSKVNVLVNEPAGAVGGVVCAPLAPCPVPGAITTSAFGSFVRTPVSNTYNDVLPSVNLRVDVAKDLVARFAAAKTLARPDYSALGGAVSLDDTNLTGNSGNPNLKPIRATNLDASIEWYFAPRSLLSFGVFDINLNNYVGFTTRDATYYNEQRGAFQTYKVSSPTNSKGKVSGFEISYQQSFGGGFGANANYTYADGKETGGKPLDNGRRDLVGNSKNTYNVGAYFENESINARINYTYRSSFFNGLDRASAQYQAAVGTLSASLGYKFNEQYSISLDMLNLNNPVLKYYANNEDQPTAFYSNGRQYYLTLRGKL
ncbi:MAG: TonB-dependent receptor [Burkholderiaceae bacterium]